MKGIWIISVIACILILGVIVPVTVFAITETVKLTASDETAADQFGTSVAISGNTAIVGAPLNDDAGSTSGSAYVFTRSGTTWTEQAKLTASDGATGDAFGISVAISGDTIVVGAHGDDDAGSDSGSAYVFTRSGTTWTEQAKLTASDGAEADSFALSVAISGDIIAIGSVGDDDAGSLSGSAYVFTRSGTTWTEEQKLTASDADVSDFFGRSVSISGDTAIVGSLRDDDAGPNSGSAYVFTRSGTTWTEEQKITASDAAAGDQFGESVSISDDTAIISARHDDHAGSASGSAYVFTRSGTTWTEEQKLTASDAAIGDFFGRSVSISGDTAIVGAFWDDDGGTNSGSAYVFTRSGTTWTEEQKITASDAAAGDQFGESVSISGDTAIVGSRFNNDVGFASGSVYVFEFIPTFDSLREQILSLGLDNGLENALISQVDAAEQQFENGNNEAAANILDAFINQAEAQTGKKIDVADAAELQEIASKVKEAIKG